MRIALTVGHSLLKNGSYTSASGEDCGGVNEYKYNKKLMKKVKKYLESDGHSVDLYICPEKVFTAASQEKSWKRIILLFRVLFRYSNSNDLLRRDHSSFHLNVSVSMIFPVMQR